MINMNEVIALLSESVDLAKKETNSEFYYSKEYSDRFSKLWSKMSFLRFQINDSTFVNNLVRDFYTA